MNHQTTQALIESWQKEKETNANGMAYLADGAILKLENNLKKQLERKKCHNLKQ